MITMAIVFLLGLSAYVCADEGEWGAVAVAVVLILLALGLCSAGRKCDRAFNNFVDHWSRR